MNEGENLSYRVEIRYNGMTHWHCQMVANGPNSDIDRKGVATGPSSDLASTWQEDPFQREPADVARAKARIRMRLLLPVLQVMIGDKFSCQGLSDMSG